MLDKGEITQRGIWEDLKEKLEQAQFEKMISEKRGSFESARSAVSSKFSSHRVSTNYGALEKQSKHSFDQANPQRREESRLVVSEETAPSSSWQDVYNYFKFAGGGVTMAFVGFLSFVSFVSGRQ